MEGMDVTSSDLPDPMLARGDAYEQAIADVVTRLVADAQSARRQALLSPQGSPSHSAGLARYDALSRAAFSLTTVVDNVRRLYPRPPTPKEAPDA